ncbi:hemagglutinin repeat-containing protein [Rugamonas sp. DEMB1]|uniref:two-partner secretion domain-containing protein n=1 Tax=Rugamonas sp. DEMB1 TaxID=3039386 RepID=UPI00244B9FF4|nr:hemagglutinin repeat-containing protein [Rugamonas sp. DEMB1]WGG52841.1 hemagglutinin repeat-containing protein [Rugamonas sp. DEMB1]
MNKHLYRIIFNERRGQLMVVGEHASAPGKAAGAGGDAVTGAAARYRHGLAAVLRPLCLALSGALGMAALLAVPVHAQIVADPNAPGKQRPTVLQTSNGVTQVNIQTPSASGVSRNTYVRFDVTAKGAVLNNSYRDVQSQLGGWVQGNPWMQRDPARVILNEVNSNDPSQLRGFVEVAGPRAEVVIANPAGVNIDGGGFINANRVVITTGLPQLNNGDLDGYLVQRGTVTVGGGGLDTAQADYTAILARAVQLNAGVWAKQLQVAVGANRIDLAPGAAAAVAPLAGTGAAPLFALDVAQMGGMYAGKITLIGTEAGLGMRNAGILASSGGDLVLQANGWLGNSGSLRAAGAAAALSVAAAGDIDNGGSVYAEGDTRLASGGIIASNGTIAAQGNTTLLANGAASRIEAGAGAVLGAGVNADGKLGTGGRLQVTATEAVAAHGTMAAGADIGVTARRLDLSGAQLSGANMTLSATAGDLDASRASVTTAGALALGAAQTVRTDGAHVTADRLAIGAHDLSNVGGHVAQSGTADLTLALAGTLDNRQGYLGSNGGNLTLDAATLLNTDGTLEHAGSGTLAMTVATLSGQRGHIAGNGALRITAGDIDQHGATLAARAIAITAASLDNSGGAISQTGSGLATLVATSSLDNTGGKIESNGDASISTDGLHNALGRIAAVGGTSVFSGDLDNAGGAIVAGTHLRVQAGDVHNQQGGLQALAGDATLRLANLNNTAGTVYAGGKLDTVAASVSNSGSLYAAGDLSLAAGGALVNSGVIAAQGHTTLSANSVESGAASLLGAGVKADGSLARAGELRVTALQELGAHGQNLAVGGAVLAGKVVDVSGGQTSATDVALNAAGGDVTTSNGTVTAGGTLAITAAQSLLNLHGSLSAGQLLAQVAGLDNTQGSIVQTGGGDTAIVLGAAGGTINNTQGRIAVNSNSLTLGAGTLINTDGKIEHAGTGALAINAATLVDNRGQISSNGALDIGAGDFNHDGASTNARNLSVRAKSMSNRAGHLLQSGDGGMTLGVAGQFDNATGEIAANGVLQMQAGGLDNGSGSITSAKRAEVSSLGALDNSYGVVAGAYGLRVDALGIDNTRGTIQAAGGSVVLQAATLRNWHGTVNAGTDLMVHTTGNLNNDGLMYAGRDQALQIDGAFVNTGAAAAQANMTITADSVWSSAGSLLGAGVRADGSLAQNGNLTVASAHALQMNGNNVAAGDAVLRAQSIDLGGSRTGAANLAVTASSGNVRTANAQVSGAGILSVTAASPTQMLDNTQGSLSAGQLVLNVAKLNNGQGSIVQSGQGDTAIRLSAPGGTLDNTAGRIAVNSGKLTLDAGTLLNTAGKIEHAGTGAFVIHAATLGDRDGQITSNGDLQIAAGDIDHRGARTSAQRTTITADNLDNRSGQIAQLGNGQGAITTSGALDNRGGKIESNGDTSIHTDGLRNQQGRIAATGNAAIVASGVDNTGGAILGGTRLTVQTGRMDNTNGSLQAVAGDAVLRVAELNNTAGSIYAGGRLDTVAASVANSGSLYAAGNQNLSVAGALVNSGVIAAQGNTTLSADSVDSSAIGLLGAGVKANGALAQTGELRVSSAHAVVSHGQNLAAGGAVLAGRTVDLGGSQSSAGQIALEASDGDVSTSNATVTAAGTLAITATQALRNEHGSLSAGQLVARVARLDNTHGAIVQTGGGDTAIELSANDGVLDNTQGRIAVNSSSLTLGAGTLINTDGRIEHAGGGTLAITTSGALDDERGLIVGNGGLRIKTAGFAHNGATTSAASVAVQADSLSNRGGHLLQSGEGSMSLGVTGQLDNATGAIAANGALQVQAGTLDNSHGRITSAASAGVSSLGALNNGDGVLVAARALNVDARALDNTRGALQAGDGAMALNAASLLNSQGMVSAGTDLTVQTTGDVRNDSVMYAGRDQTLRVDGAFVNTGSAAALGNMTIAAGSVQSGAASLLGAGVRTDGGLAQGGNLTVTSAHVLQAIGHNVAAGDAALSGASVDLSGSQTGAANIAVTAGSGDVRTAQAQVATAGTLSVTAAAAPTQVLDNTQGSLSAGQLALNVANLNNGHGSIVQSGGGDTALTLSAPGGTLNNTAGRIAVNSANLTLGAATLINQDGKIEHAGSGTLAMTAATLKDQHGQIVGNGTLRITAGDIDHRDASSVAQRLAITAANLDNRAGQIAQLGGGQGAVTASGALDNRGGRIDSNGDMTLGAATLDNSGSHIGAVGSVHVGASTALNNAGGLIAAGSKLTLQAGSVDNSRGSLQAIAGDAALRVADLNNAAGSIYAGGQLDTVANSVNNSGSLYAAGSQSLSVAGALVNSGVIAAQVNTTLSANTLDNSAAGLLAAGMKADGTLAQTGDLRVTAAQTMGSHGQNLAGGQAVLTGRTVDLGGSQTSAAQIALNANGGNVVTSNATVTAADTLAVTASQTLVNGHGTLSAGQLLAQVAGLDNTQGTIVQTGAGDTAIVLSTPGGTLNNTQGRIAVNSNNLTLGAGTLINADGKIEHAGGGTLAINAGTLSDARGQITGNGDLNITAGNVDHVGASTLAQRLTIAAGKLDNRQGSITQLGAGNTSVAVSGTLDNRNGVVASNGDTTLSTGALNNRGGIVQGAGTGGMRVSASGLIDNSGGGRIASGGDLVLSGGDIANQQGQISAAGKLGVAAAQGIHNGQGLLAANGDATLTANVLDNTDGKLASVQGNVSVTTGGNTVNDSGVIQALGDIALRNGGLSNTQASGHAVAGSIVGSNVVIDSHGQAIDNRLGTVAAAQALNVRGGALNNDAGLLQAGTTLALDTGALTNTNAAAYAAQHAGGVGGIVSGGAATLHLGDWNNAAGFFGAGGAVTGSSGRISNTLAGQLVGQSSVNLAIAGLDNQGGQIQTLGDLTLQAGAGAIDNRHSLIRSGGSVSLSAAQIDNRDTQGANQGIEGKNVNLTAGVLNNVGGAVRAEQDVTVTSSGSVDNSGGLMSGGRKLSIADASASRALAVTNTGGTLIGGSDTAIRAASLTLDGRLLSLGDLTLDLSGNYRQDAGGELTTNGNATIILGGDLQNAGTLRAGGTLAITAANIENTASGDMHATTTRVSAAGVLNNRGVIDGGDTEVNAGTLNNLGAGRIYGDHLSIGAGTLNNNVEGGIAATIAARGRLDIGAQAINNNEHALIFSAGELAIGGALDAGRSASGQAGVVNNASATIEALGGMSLAASQVNNLNSHFSIGIGESSAPQQIVEYEGKNSPRRYAAGTPGVQTYNDESLHLRTPEGEFEEWNQYNVSRTTRQSVITNSDPGRIVSGGNLSISGGGILNDNSHILAGGMLSINAADLSNPATQGQKITTDVGTATANWRVHRKGTDGSGNSTTSYAPPDTIETITLSAERHETGVAPDQMASAPGAAAAVSVNGATSAAGTAGAIVKQAAIVKVGASVDAVATADGQQAAAAAGASGLNGSQRAGNAAQAGSVATATGAQAAASAAAAAPAGGTAVDVQFAGAGVAARQVDAAAGAAGLDGTARAGTAAQAGNIAAASGERAAAAVGSPGPDHAGLAVAAEVHAGPASAAGAVKAATGLSGPDAARMGRVEQDKGAHATGGAQVVRTGTPPTRIPNASLYTVNAAPTAGHLVETDPRFAGYREWRSSDYMVAAVQLAPDVTQKRLGDGFYEQGLVRAQVAQLTGRRFLGDYSNDDEQYQALMDAGVAYAKQWNLRPGVALTPAQMATLSSDIVWLVEQEVTLADGSVQKVLAPQVYVRVRQGDLDGGGALLSGKNVDVQVTGDLLNSGTIAGRDVVRLTADNVQNLGGRIHGDAVAVTARTDLNNIGGTISANSALVATAGRDIHVETTTRSAASAVDGNSFSRTNVDRVASLYVTGDGATGGGTLLMQAGRDIALQAARIGNAGQEGATVLSAGRDIGLGTVTTASANNLNWDANNFRHDSVSNEVGSQIQATGGIALKAGGDINLRAADLQAGGALSAQAGNNLNITAGVATLKIDEARQHMDTGFLNKSLVTTRDTRDSSSAVGSSLGGATVALGAGHDLSVLGSAVLGDQPTVLTAGHDVTIAAATETSSTTSHRSVQEKGLLGGGGGFGISYGTRTTTTDRTQDATTQSGQARSMVGSSDGSLSVTAGEGLKVSGSDLAAAQDMSLAGKSVVIDPGRDDSKGKFTLSRVQDGFTLAVGGSVVEALQAIDSANKAIGNTKNARVQAMAAATAAMAAKNAAAGIAKNGVNVSISLTAGHSESQQTQTTASVTNSGSALTAGNNLSISASGGGKDSNITVLGSDLSAKGDIKLRADNNVNLLAAQDTESQHSESKSMSAAAGIGASIGTQGMSIGFTASLSAGRGKEDGEGTTQLNSHVTAGRKLDISSGGDTNIRGAVASGQQVVANVGGNLNLESLQDTAKFDSKNQSISVSGTVGMGASVSGSVNQSKIHSDYASVQEQSGIQAGDGGFQVKVGGNTDLKGAVISATAAGATASVLDTGTLTSSDIANHATTQGSSVGVSGGMTMGGSGDGKGAGPGGTDLQNMGKSSSKVNTPVAAATSANDSSTTRSGVGAGQLVIRDDAAQLAATGKGAAQTAADTNRKVETGVDTSGRIANNFDKKEVETMLATTAAFIQAAAPLAANLVGDIGKEKQDAAQFRVTANQQLAEEARANGDTEKANEYAATAAEAQRTADNWGDNGVYRIGLHVAAQGLIGGVTGGGAGAAGAAGGVVAGNQGQQLGQALGEAEADKRKLTGTAREDLVNTYKETFATLGGALGGLAASAVGGQGGASALTGAAQGANAAETVDRYNRQLHKSEADKLAFLKKDKTKAEQYRLDAAACALVKCADGVPTSDPLYAKVRALQNDGQYYMAEQKTLKGTGEFVYAPYLDSMRDFRTRKDEVFHRGGGLVNLGFGAVGTVGGGIMTAGGAASCPATLGAGCGVAVLGGVVTVVSWKQANDGNQALLGSYMSSEGRRVLDSFNSQTYPSENDPLKTAAIDGAKFVATLGVAKVIGKLASNTSVQVAAPKDVKIVKVSQEAPAAGGANGAADISSSSLGEFLGKGGNKNVFVYGDNQAVAVLQAGKNPQLITDEIGMLNQLNVLGIPTVNARGVTVSGQPGMLMDKFAQGSKDVVALQNGKVRVIGDSSLLNSQSVTDLQNIKQTMIDKNIKIDDLQFLIGYDGRVVVADPLKVFSNIKPSPNNLRTIDLLIQQAKKNGK